MYLSEINPSFMSARIPLKFGETQSGSTFPATGCSANPVADLYVR
jgi:hypothetical protein